MLNTIDFNDKEMIVTSEDDLEVFSEFIKDSIKINIGGLVKPNPKYNYPNNRVYQIKGIMTIGRAKEITRKYLQNREEVDRNQEYNDLIKEISNAVSNSEDSTVISSLIDKGIELMEENEDLQAVSILREIKSVVESSTTSSKNKVKKFIDSKKRKSKQYKNFSTLISNLGADRPNTLGFQDDALLILMSLADDPKSKPIWVAAKYLTLVDGDREIELYNHL